MIKEQQIEIDINNRNKSYYIDKGYNITKETNKIIINIEDLNINSHVKIRANCTLCNKETKLMYYKYIQNINRCGYYSCKSCSREKAKITNNILYGADNFMQSKEGKQKYIDKCLDKYGVSNVLLVPEIQQKLRNTINDKYGSNCALQNKNVIIKSKQTNLKKYGAEYFNKSLFFKNKIHKSLVNFYNIILPKEYNINDFIILDENKLKIKCNLHNDYYETTYKLLYQRTKLYNVCPCTKCNPIDNKISLAEQELYNFLKKYIDVEQTNKTILNGKHLDIYCKDLNLAIEYNGIFLHSEKYIENDFHFKKSIDTRNKNIKLFHIFENEYINNKQNIKNLLLNFINNTYIDINNYKINNIDKNNIKYKDIFNGTISNNNYELIHDDNIVANISFNDNTITYFNFNTEYNPTTIFNIFNNELNLYNYYYIHDNNNIFLDLHKLNFIKYLEPNYKYHYKNDILIEKEEIEQKYNNNSIDILNNKYFKIYDCGYTLFSLQEKHSIFNKEIVNFLNDNNINYFVENNNYCFLMNNNRKIELCYIDKNHYNLNNINIDYFYKLSYNAEINNSFKFLIKDFELDNENQKEILKSYILHFAGKTKNKIYARDCEIKIIDSKIARQFESENCFYGKRGASLNLGLVLKKNKYNFKKGDLIMLYTFGYNYFSKDKNTIEVIRVGTLKYHYVVGGSSKLFNHFIKNYNELQISNKLITIQKIKFYSDYDHNLGNSLNNLGFIFKNYSKGGYMNYLINSNQIKHRQPMKHKEIKNDNNIIVIPNAGVKVFEYII